MKKKEYEKTCLAGSVITIMGVVIMLFWFVQAKMTNDEWIEVNILSIGIPLILVNMGMMYWLSGKVGSILKGQGD